MSPIGALPPTKAGSGHLCVEKVAGQSAITSAAARSPMKILTPKARGQSVWAFLSSYGGGLVAGDETSVAVSIGPGATCYLSTQASTKVYRNPEHKPCGHTLTARLGSHSLLVSTPDPVQAFEGSCFLQRQTFNLGPESDLVHLDWVSSGRAARGERWGFRRYQSRTEIMVDERRLYLDSLLLDPSDGPLTSPFRMGRFNCLAVLIVLGPALARGAQACLQSLGDAPVTSKSELVASASPIQGGAIIRIAAEAFEPAARMINQCLAFVPELLGDDPWARKW